MTRLQAETRDGGFETKSSSDDKPKPEPRRLTVVDIDLG